MVKITIALCTLLLFTSIQGDPVVSDDVESIRTEALGHFDHMILELMKNKFKYGDKSYQSKHDSKLMEIIDLSVNISEKMGVFKHEDDSSFIELIDGAKGVEIYDCWHHHTDLTDKVELIFSRSLKCLETAILSTTNNAQSIDVVYKDVHVKLLKLKRKIQLCYVNKTNPDEVVQLKSLIKSAKIEAETIRSEVEPLLSSKTAEVDDFLENVQNNLKNCTIEAGIETMDEDLSVLVNDRTKCIQTKIDEARGKNWKNNHTNGHARA